jgi:hypothetical protein
MIVVACSGLHPLPAILDRLGVVRPQVQKVLDRLTGVPVDVEPAFTTAVSQ